jgi:hypothetical protein
MILTNIPGGGGTRLRDKTDPDEQTSDRPLYESIGSGNLNIAVDEETGRATETISGQGSTSTPGSTTQSTGTEDDVDVATLDASTSTQTVEQTEQAVEEATDGAAFGDPDEIEDIGTGEAVREVGDSDPATASVFGDATEGALPIDQLLIVAVLAVGALMYFGGS